MNTKLKDTFFDNYTFGTITSPDNIEADELLAWFRNHNIIAGVARTDKHTYEFYVPMFENPYIEDKTLIGTVTPDGDLDFKLLSDQFALELANDFSADVYMDSASYDFADWSDEPKEEPAKQTATYIVSKAPVESAINYAHTAKQTVEYTRLNKFSLWKTMDYGASWYDYGFMPRELPAFIFEDGLLMVQYKAMSDPIHLHPTGRIKMSYHEVPDASWEDNRAGVAMEEISNTQLRPGGGIDMLIRAGVLKKSRAEQLLDVLSGDQKDFVAGICKVFDLPGEIAQHITAGTMPEDSQTAKVSGWFKLFSRTIEEYVYEPDPHAGPIKRFYAYISARPLLDWTWMIGELTLGAVMVYHFLISQLGASQPWWYYLLGVIGVFFIIESLIGMRLTIKRKLRP